MEKLVRAAGEGFFDVEPKSNRNRDTITQNYQVSTHARQNEYSQRTHTHTKLACNGGSNQWGLRALRRRNGNPTHCLHLHEIHQAKANMRLPR
jgi:hypothetical protein